MSVIALPKTPGGLKDIGRLQDIPAVRQLALLVVAAAAIALGLWLFFWTQKPSFVPVYAGVDAKATADASDLLRGKQIPFRLDGGSGALAVPADRVGDARLALAAAGLGGNEGGGFATMEGDQGFGTSQFIENARYQHALETELARTIANLRPVREARVHLALPKPSAFTRQKTEASASVVLQLQSGASLEQGQVDAIERLVASSIPDLTPDRVTVVDQFGRLLSLPERDSEAAIGAERFDQQRRQEAVYVQRIQQLLEPMTGPGRVSAQVSVDMDFAQTEEARETYGPQAGMVRSEQIAESGNATPAGGANATAQGVPGSASNTPAAAADAKPAANANPAQAAQASNDDGTVLTGPTSRTAVRNYEIDRTLTHTRRAPGRIQRITAAVLVDNLPQGAPDADGHRKTRALTPAELKRIETLVQQAIGYDAQRGDAVSVVNQPFATGAALDLEDSGPPAWQDPRARDLLRTVLGGLALLLVVWFVLRPAFRQLLQPRAQAQATVRAELLDDEEVPVAISPGASRGASPAQAMSLDDKLQVARTAVSNDPKRVAQVVRDWVGEEA
ncbi:MAG TPA: flagellar basal-body MS-ring/collar protein FliF [Xanthomonadaceae bacterium]|nr:flagellar basal-body MS-ring/collar protein FliF [Xanthomonadaceae bacterium]